MRTNGKLSNQIMAVADTSETTNNIHGVRCNMTANVILSALRKSNLAE
jgi:hypothetical protein